MGFVHALLLLAPGCDQIFPQPQDLRPSGDLGGDAATGAAVLAGRICQLSELHDYRGCVVRAPPGPISLQVLEGGATAQTDAGAFRIELPSAPPLLTLLATDPRQQLSRALIQLPRMAPESALPMVPVERTEQLRLQGIPLQPGRGGILSYVVDRTGAPVQGVKAQVQVSGGAPLGPYYDDGGEVLLQGGRTGPGGLVAFFELLPGTVTLTLTGARQDSYQVPVAAGALSFTLLP